MMRSKSHSVWEPQSNKLPVDESASLPEFLDLSTTCSVDLCFYCLHGIGPKEANALRTYSDRLFRWLIFYS